MARCLAIVLAGAFSVFVLMPAPAEAVCRPQCLDVNKKRAEARDYDFGDRWEHGQHSEPASGSIMAGQNMPFTRTTVNTVATAVTKNRPSRHRR